MKNFLSKLGTGKSGESSKQELPTEFQEDYVELSGTSDGPKSKIVVRPFVIQDFTDIKPALDALREGYTIVLANIGPLKQKDMIEVKRVVAKLKKTCEAIDGDLAGFGDDWIVITPSFASVYRNKDVENIDGQE